jgi:long-chain fatty acid transport protein
VGTEIRDATALGTGFRLGARYRASDAVTLGLAFGSEIDLPVRDGELRANLGPGLGKVDYRDLEIDGLAQAAELGAGVAWQVAPDWLVAADLTWLDWSDALGRSTLRASDPDDPRAPPELRSESTSDWSDQGVVAVGTAYRPAPAWTLWAGYNYGRNPIPNDHPSPLLPNIGEHHLTGGAAWQVGERVRAGFALEYLLPNEVDYDNRELPLGQDLRARTSYLALHLGLSLTW